MNPVQSSLAQHTTQVMQSGNADPAGSVMEFMMEEQHLLTKEAKEDRQMERQLQAQERQREEQAQELQGQAQAQQGQGFFQSIANFLTGNDGGSGNSGTRFAQEKVEQSSLAWDDWKKFLKLH